MSADLHHLAAAYALDALDDVERRQFENHFPTCDICAAEVHEFRGVAAELGASTAVSAPDRLRGAVMAEIAQTRQLSPLVQQPAASSSNRLRSGQFIAAAAAALVLLAGVLVVTLPDDDPSFSEVADAPDAVVTSLEPLLNAPSGALQIVWSDELDQVAVIGSGLDDPGIGRTYALWFLVDGGVVPAGLFQPDDGSVTTVLEVDDIDTSGWGITVEPEGGSDQPTTDVIFAGNL